MTPINRQEQEIPALQADLAALDAEMTVLREQKEAIMTSLRALQRQRDAIAEPLERKRAIEQMTKPITIIGL